MELISAVSDNSIDKVIKLLKLKDTDINYQDKQNKNWTALHYSCEYGYEDIVQILLKQRDIQVNPQSERGFTPFYLACANQHKRIITWLLKDSRVNVNTIRKADCWTPLICSCYFGRLESVKMLVGDLRVDLFMSVKADFWSGIDDGFMALDIAKITVHFNKSIVELIEEEINRRKQKGFVLLLLLYDY